MCVRFDSRDTKLEDGSHWTNEKLLESSRVYFRFKDQPAKLTIDNVKDSDGGSYVCRVDYKLTPTQNTVVNLTVISTNEKAQYFVNYTEIFSTTGTSEYP